MLRVSNDSTSVARSSVGDGAERSFGLVRNEYAFVSFSTQKRDVVRVKQNFSFSLRLV